MTKRHASSADEQAAALSGVMHELRDQVEVLRMAIDELREEIQTAVRTIIGQDRPVMRLTSMATDPCADDFGAQLNALSDEKRNELRQAAAAPMTSGRPSGHHSTREDQPRPQSAARPADSLSAAAPTGASQQQAPSASALPADAALSRGKPQPLYMRIYGQPLLTEIVRAIGYQTLPAAETRRRLEPLFTRYGHETVAAAVEELLVAAGGGPDTWQLGAEVRRAARALLGPPPESARRAEAAPAQQSSAPTPSAPNQTPAAADAPLEGRDVKSSRKEVLVRFREHLEATGEVTADLPATILQILGGHGRMLPDLMLGEAPPYELLAVRRRLSSAQRHDMEQWLEATDFGHQATRVWPLETSAGWEWNYEIIATKQDDDESESGSEPRSTTEQDD